jgi:predicted site-specific integrase-resolvase
VINVYRIGEFAKRVGRSASTVRRWEREGRIQARRGPTGQRYEKTLNDELGDGAR